MTVQPDLCRTCSETTLLVFPRDGSFDRTVNVYFRDSFSTMSQAEKIRSVSKLLEQLVDAVSLFEPRHDKTNKVVSKQVWQKHKMARGLKL